MHPLLGSAGRLLAPTLDVRIEVGECAGASWKHRKCFSISSESAYKERRFLGAPDIVMILIWNGSL